MALMRTERPGRFVRDVVLRTGMDDRHRNLMRSRQKNGIQLHARFCEGDRAHDKIQ